MRWKSHPYATIRTPSLRFRVFTEARPYCSSIARTPSSVVTIVTLIGQRENVLVSDSKSKLPAEFIYSYNNVQYQLLTKRCSIHVQKLVFYSCITSVIMFMIITITVLCGKYICHLCTSLGNYYKTHRKARPRGSIKVHMPYLRLRRIKNVRTFK